MIGKFLGIATIGSTMAGAGFVNRLLVATAQFMILAIVCAFMFCASLACVFTILYFFLLQLGVAPYSAGISVGIVALLVTGALAAVTFYQLRQLRKLSHHSLRGLGGHVPDIGHVVAAFMDGFLNKKN